MTRTQREAYRFTVGGRLWLAFDGSGVAGQYPKIVRRFSRRTMSALIDAKLISAPRTWSGSSAWPYLPCRRGDSA